MTAEMSVVTLMRPNPRLDHPQDYGGEEAERYDGRDHGQFGCEFHRKLSFPIGGVPVPQTARFYAPLSECQVVLLLQRTIMDALRAEPNNVWRGFWVHAHDNFLPDRLFPPLKAVGFGGAPRAPAAKIEDARLG